MADLNRYVDYEKLYKESQNRLEENDMKFKTLQQKLHDQKKLQVDQENEIKSLRYQ
jgi:hypothetical protein